MDEETTVLSNTLIVELSNFTNNNSSDGGGAISLVSNSRTDQATKSALITDW